MKLPTDNIFQLIRSMTASEKRYFKRHYSSEKGLATALFDYINSLDFYDEDIVKKHFSKSKLSKNLKVYKVQLTDLLLKSLTSYHSKKSVVSSIRIGLEEIDILIEKKLYSLADKRLKKTKELCLKYQESSYFFPILFIELHLKRFYSINDDDTRETIFDEMNENVETITRLLKLQEISFTLSNKINNELTQQFDQSEKEALKKILNDELLKTKDKELSFKEQYYLNTSLAKLYSVLEEESTLEYDYRKKTIDLFNNNKDIRTNQTQFYWAALYNYIFCCLELGKYEELEEGIEKVKDLANDSPYLERNLIFVYYLETKYNFIQNNFEFICENLEHKFKKQIEVYQQEEEFVTILTHIYFTITHLVLGDAQRVQFYLRRLFASNQIVDTGYIQFFELLELISHFETKDYDLIQNQLSSLKRKLKKEENTSLFYKETLNFFNDLTKTNKADRSALAKAFKENIEQFKNDPVYNIAKEFVLDDWLNAVILEKQFSERNRDQKVDI